MSVKLTQHDEDMLAGREGAGAQTAMSILVKMAEILEAERMISITGAHIDACGLLSDAGTEFAEMLVEKGARVSVPATLNMGPLDLQNWRQFGIDKKFAQKAIRQSKAYTDMGCVPSWTCAPYQGDNVPSFGEQVAWGESNAVCYANSVLGARTNRYADFMDICAAITGRVPEWGLHIKENRRGQIHIRLNRINETLMNTQTFYVTLGHLVGRIAIDKIAVIQGLNIKPSSDELKAMCAAAASSGGVEMFHIAGITPEAQTLENAFLNQEPLDIIEFGPKEMAGAELDLSNADNGEKLDAVLVGCPHFSMDEFSRLAKIIQGQLDKGGSLHRGVRFIVTSCRSTYAQLERSDLLEPIKKFGIEITLDTCPFHTPMLPSDTKVVMTDSGKCAYYAPGELGVKVAFGSMADCVESAVKGGVCRKEILWE